MQNRSLVSTGGIALIAVLLLFVNVVAKSVLASSRIDLTEGKLFTLSDGTKAILEDLQEPVTLRYYFTRDQAVDYAPVLSHADRTESLLREFERNSDGKLTVEISSPEPFSDAEDRAIEHGIQGVYPPGSADPLYFGIAGTNSTDGAEVIPFLDPQREPFLEYDLAKMVYTLGTPEKPVVGVLSTLPIEGQGDPRNPMSAPQPWQIMDDIRQTFEVRSIQPMATAIPEEVDLLFLVHPKGFTNEMLYAIDQFVMGGGRVLALLDAFSVLEQVPQDPQNPMASAFADRSSDLGPLLESWGLTLIAGKIVTDQKFAPQREVQVEDPVSKRTVNVRDLVQPTPFGDGFNADDPVVSSLKGGVALHSAGCLVPQEGTELTLTPLIESSDEAMLASTSQLQPQPDLAAINRDFVATGTHYAFAYRVEGPATSAYPDGPPPPPEGTEDPPTPAEHLAESSSPINLIVASDADFLYDQLWLGSIAGQVFPVADNGNFVVNALDNLSGSSDLISLRGRGVSKRPFTHVDELEAKANAAFRDEERLLAARLEQTNQDLQALQREKSDGQAFVLSPEQEAKIEEFRATQVETRKALRDVRHELNKEKESLGTKLKIANIFGMPLMVVLAALGMWQMQNSKRPKR